MSTIISHSPSFFPQRKKAFFTAEKTALRLPKLAAVRRGKPQINRGKKQQKSSEKIVEKK